MSAASHSLRNVFRSVSGPICSPSASDTAPCTVLTAHCPEMSTFSIVAVVAGPQEHVFAVGSQCRVLDQFAAAVDPHVVVGVRLVCLQQVNSGLWLKSTPSLRNARPSSKTRSTPPTHNRLRYSSGAMRR